MSRAARLGAGLKGPQLEALLHPHGFTLRHYPQSFEFSTLGGWIATRAAGHFATLKTRIDDLVESVRMLTPSGRFEARRLPASGAGPDPNRWVLGSEGTLGVITEAWVRVVPRPRFRARAAIHFDSFLAGAEAARELAQSGLHPANCRLLDPAEAELFGVTAEPVAVLLLGFESAERTQEPWMDSALAICLARGGRCPTGPRFQTLESTTAASPLETDRWRDAFLEAPYLQTTLVSLGVLADTFETACTWDRFPAFHASVQERVQDALRKVLGAGRLSCRLTHVYPDGPAPYYTFLGPARDGAEVEQWSRIKEAASEAIIAGGGTITHHHAVGRLHRPWYGREAPPIFLRALAALKAELDPAGILNPGALLSAAPPRRPKAGSSGRP
jgi:alkyldihydroxyacetonephosphate synthase